MTPRFYFTVHGGDMIRGRLLEGAHIMIVASAFWDNDRGRFKIARPPADHIASICIDSGGFTAAKRWGRYPWTVEQYADWIRAESRDVPLDFCAVMDYACEPGVDRSVHRTNRDRIKATIRNEAACKCAAPDLPWLPVLQGDSLAERAFDLALRRRVGMLPSDYAGIGSVCGRGAAGARPGRGKRYAFTAGNCRASNITVLGCISRRLIMMRSTAPFGRGIVTAGRGAGAKKTLTARRNVATAPANRGPPTPVGWRNFTRKIQSIRGSTGLGNCH